LIAVHVPNQERKFFQLRIKRILDICLSLTLFVLLAPLAVLIALAVRVDSPGPVFYRWPVVGKGGIPFEGWKFRSMCVQADMMKRGMKRDNEMKGPVFKLSRDPRVTRVGRILRKYSLDEIPQLISVLKGDMSLVGPRPPLREEFAAFEDWHKNKLNVTPGMTCLWQVAGRNQINDFNDWVRLDLNYIENWSLWLDIKILFKTIPVVVFGRGC